MNNEIIFFTTIVLDLGFVTFMSHFKKEGLIAAIVLNLILVSTFGGMLVSFFSFVTNAGNVFYASIFLAINLLVEKYGKKSALGAVYASFITLIVFIFMAQLTIRFSAPLTSGFSQAVNFIFKLAPRIALASMIAYITAASFNIWLFEKLRQKSGEKLLWFRNGASQVFAQAIDSVLFFSIAFMGILPFPLLIQTIIIGFVAKVIVALLSTPFIYISHMNTEIETQ